MQYRLSSLFHLCYVAAAISLAINGIQSGKIEKVISPLLMLGVLYTAVVAYRLRHTIARFAWDVTKFSACWIFLIAYASLAITYMDSLSVKRPSSNLISVGVICQGLCLGLSPLALWASYCLLHTYRRAKLEPNDDYC